MISSLAQKQLKARQGQGTVRALGLVAMFSLLLLMVQGADLAHSHEGELEAQFNCHICMKLGGGDDALLVSTVATEYSRASLAPLQLSYSLLTPAVLTANARAPPQL